MTVGELREWLDGVSDDLEVVTDEYNSGYGGLFSAGPHLVKAKYVASVHHYEENDDGETVLVISPRGA